MATNLVVSDYGLGVIDSLLAAGYNAIPVEVGLFVNNITPDRTTIFSDLTEAVWTSYTRFNVDDWAPAAVAAHLGLLVASPKIWTFDGSVSDPSIYGYFVQDNAGHLLWCQRDPSAPVVLSLLSPFYALAPRFTAYSQYP